MSSTENKGPSSKPQKVDISSILPCSLNQSIDSIEGQKIKEFLDGFIEMDNINMELKIGGTNSGNTSNQTRVKNPTSVKVSMVN